MIDPLPFQRRFLAKAFAPGIRTACLSLPRGNGKSTLSGHLVARALTPGDPLFVPGSESVLLAGSIEQCRVVFRVVRAILEPTGQYRFLDSATRCGITHKPTRTRLRVHGSNARTAFGLVGVPLVIWDEPGAAEVNAGQVLWDAVRTSQGKPGSPLRAMLIGTLAPAVSGWWHDLIKAGSAGPVHVTSLQGRADRWDQWPEIRRCNPLMAKYAESRAALLDEREDARRDSRLKAAFLSYRLNLPTADESEVLLTVDDWNRACARPEALPAGQPIVAVDLGGGRAWSAAVAIWESGRVEAMALAPGIPDLAEQEKRDRVPAGVYRTLAESGGLRVSTGLRVQPPGDLVTMIADAWGRPAALWCDRFRLNELQDAAPGWNLQPRVTRWSEASEDIRALRKITLDGPLSVDAGSRDLLTASLSVATVKNDDQGSVRLSKTGTHNTARDDVAAALVLAAGAWSREQTTCRPAVRYLGAAG